MVDNKRQEGSERIREEMESTAESLRRFAREKSAIIAEVAGVIAKCVDAGGAVFFAGNGGSAAQAQHAAAELVGRFGGVERRGYSAVALTTDTSVLTSLANDYGYEHVFERQLEALAKSGDLFVGISTSGKSANVIKAMEIARKLKVITVGLTGPGKNEMADLADYLIDTSPGPTWRIQEAHLAALHMLCAEIERTLEGE